jgi:hypothetical protein
MTHRKAHLSSKKLLEQCQKLEKLRSHIFTASLDLSSENWYNKLVDLIDKQQTAPIWMSETKVHFLFTLGLAGAGFIVRKAAVLMSW